jgi:hypothetical protein
MSRKLDRDARLLGFAHGCIDYGRWRHSVDELDLETTEYDIKTHRLRYRSRTKRRTKLSDHE